MRCTIRVAAIAAVAIIAICTALATTASAEDFTMGLEAGVGASMFPPPAAESGETIALAPGAVVGFYAVIPILKSVSFVPELLYVQKYSRRTLGSSKTDLRVEYVELPLLAKMSLFWGWYIAEGVSLGFPVQMRGLAPNLAQITSPDVSIVMGGGHNIGKKLVIEFRYESGLRRVVKLDTVPVQRTRTYAVLAKLHY